MKKCSGCSIEKTLDNFYLNKTGFYHPFCKPCNTIRTREWRSNNTHKHYLNKAKGKFKITKDEYDALIKKHNGVCAICLMDNDNRRLSIDHCHATGRIRGLLCRKCNLAIGYFSDDVNIIKRALDYLRVEDAS